MRILLCAFVLVTGLFGQQSPALEALIQDADRALTAGPYSVMNKQLTPPSGDKHDYMSVGPYWWPDPAKKDGLPYIRKDGERNPDRNDNRTDRSALGGMFSSVGTLALAYRETGREAYAARAVKLVEVWFIDPATKMNPNLDFGQSIPGRTTGRGTGLIDTAGLIPLTRELHWLAKSKSFSPADQQAMKEWFTQFLTWMQTSKNGREEAEAENNHGMWYDAQVVAFALYTGKQDLARSVLETAKTKRLAAQIEPDGKQPRELARTNALSYSTMNLRAMMELAAMAQSAGIDLWNFKTKDGRGIKTALDYIAPYVDPEKKWEGAQIGGVKLSNRMEIAPLLRQAALAYKEPRYESMLGKLPQKELIANRMQLIWPAPK